MSAGGKLYDCIGACAEWRIAKFTTASSDLHLHRGPSDAGGFLARSLRVSTSALSVGLRSLRQLPATCVFHSTAGLDAGQHMVPRRCAFPEMTPNHCVYTLTSWHSSTGLSNIHQTDTMRYRVYGKTTLILFTVCDPEPASTRCARSLRKLSKKVTL